LSEQRASFSETHRSDGSNLKHFKGPKRRSADCDLIVCYGGAKLADKHLAAQGALYWRWDHRMAEVPWATTANDHSVQWQ